MQKVITPKDGRENVRWGSHLQDLLELLHNFFEDGALRRSNRNHAHMILIFQLQLYVYRVRQHVLVFKLKLYQVEGEVNQHNLCYKKAYLEEEYRYHQLDEC